MRKVILAIGILGLVLAGCGDDDEPTVSGADGASTTSAGAPAAKDTVGITMNEYSYVVDGALKAGGTVELTNAGKEFHMLGVGKFKDGKTLADLQAALSKPEPAGDDSGGSDQTSTTAAAGGEGEGEREDPTKDVIDEVELPIGAFMGPGQTAGITVPDFGAGEYAIICFIPTEGGGPPHFAQGMLNTLTVAGEKAAEPTADATYNLEQGKPVTGPATLKAGRHVLKFTAPEGSDELEPGILKPDAGKTVADMDKVFDSFESQDDFSLPKGAADLVPGDVVVGVFDLGPARTMYVTVDLTPGTYTIIAQDSDQEDAPSDPVEKILVKVA